MPPSATPPAPRRPPPPRGVRQRRAHADEIYRRLETTYPDAHCELVHRNAYELLAATILSAQCTDRRVNMVTPSLFDRYPTPDRLSAAPLEDVEELIRTTGFFRAKARSLVGMATAVTERHAGEIPRTMDELTRLPGVGRKTANVLLGNAYGINVGVVVDTHIGRVSARLRLTRETDPVKIEQDLIPLFDRDRWTMLAHLMIFHGRRICAARKPRCGICPLADICPSVGIG